MKKKTSIAATTLAVMAAAIPAYAAPADEAVTTNLEEDIMLINEVAEEEAVTTNLEKPTEDDVMLIDETTEEITSKVEGLENLSKELQEKVDSIVAEISVQENGTIIDLVGDEDDLANVDTLEVTEEGLFINVGEDRVKFESELKLPEVAGWDDLRVIRLGGSPVPHMPSPEGFTITTDNFNGLVVMPKEEEPFTDVNEEDWFQYSVNEAFNYGFITGTTGETFEPNSSITRGQFAVILARAFEIPPVEGKSTLTDIHQEWFGGEVQALVDLGIIKGYTDGTFGGHKPVTRQQVALMFNRALETLAKDVKFPSQAELDKVQFGGLDKSGEEAVKAIKTLAALGAVVGVPNIDFKPHTNATRAEVVEVLVRALPQTGLY